LHTHFCKSKQTNEAPLDNGVGLQKFQRGFVEIDRRKAIGGRGRPRSEDALQQGHVLAPRRSCHVSSSPQAAPAQRPVVSVAEIGSACARMPREAGKIDPVPIRHRADAIADNACPWIGVDGALSRAGRACARKA
jgi:hypothetical protein